MQKIMNPRLLDDLVDYLNEEHNAGIKRVFTVTEDTVKEGYCPTCWIEETVLKVQGADTNNKFFERTYYENFADFMDWVAEKGGRGDD